MKPYMFFPDKEVTERGLTKVPHVAQIESHRTPVQFAAVGSSVRLSITPESGLEGEIGEVALSSLTLDPNNVRFRDRKRALDDHEIEEEIWNEPTTRNLMREIYASRGLSEMPIVDSRMTVREGNRRVVCLRRLSRLATEGKLRRVQPDTFAKVRCVLLRPEVSEKDISIYLARVHVGGKRQWMAVNKAAHVFELHTREGMSYEQIREFLSINQSTAERMIRAFRDTLAYRERYPDDPGWATKYSYFDEIYKREDLRDWVQRKGNCERLMDWIHTERIRAGLDIRKLPLILQNRYATQILEKSNAEKAYGFLAKKDPRLADGFYGKIGDIISTMQALDNRQLLLAARDRNRTRLIQSLLDSCLRLTKKIERVNRVSRQMKSGSREETVARK